MDNATWKVYDKTLAYIAKTYSSLTIDHEGYARFCRRIFALAPMAGGEFVGFVGQERPRALAILAHHCAMMQAVNEAWFFRGVAERELNGISRILPQEWKWAMEWPRATFSTIEPLECSWSEDGEKGLTVDQEVSNQR